MKAQGGQIICEDHTLNERRRWDLNPDSLAPEPMLSTSVPALPMASLLSLGKNQVLLTACQACHDLPSEPQDLTFHYLFPGSQSQGPPQFSLLTPGFFP